MQLFIFILIDNDIDHSDTVSLQNVHFRCTKYSLNSGRNRIIDLNGNRETETHGVSRREQKQVTR